MVPKQMDPNQFSSRISGPPQSVPLNKQNILGTICPGGPNFWGPFVHGLRTPNEGIKQRNLKIWADVADKICSGHT